MPKDLPTTWASVLLKLTQLPPPRNFTLDKDTMRYREASHFITTLGIILDPIIDDIMSELQDTSSVQNTNIMRPSQLFDEFLVPEITSTIETIETDDDEPEDEREFEPDEEFRNE